MVNENLEKHLEFIQNVITRMANNSFLLKGWTVTIVAALFALAAQNANYKFVILAIFPVVAFWILDAFYLWQERLYRDLYNDIRCKDPKDIQSNPFSLDPTPKKKGINKIYAALGWIMAAFSITLVIFYGVIFGAIVMIIRLTLL